MSNKIVCPECRCEIEVTEVLSAQLRLELRREFDADQRKKEGELAARETALADARKQIEQQSKSLEETLGRRLEQERGALESKAREKSKADFTAQMAHQAEELNETKAKLAEAQKAELDLIKQKRDLESQKNELELRVAREMEKERGKIRDEAKKEMSDERAFKDAESAKLISDLTKQIDELKRKAEQGSQQTQGEVMELELESMLPRQFPFDSIQAISKGVRGADVLQIVHDTSGAQCGSILWESKNAKNWGGDWLEKLRNDQREAKAQLAILVSVELPRGLTTFGNLDGVWVTSWTCAMPLATALRAGLIEIAKTARSQDGKHGKMELIYNYLSGPEFRHRIEGIVESFVAMQGDLETEKRAQTKMWAKREKQLNRAVAQTAGMYGDFQGIVGASLPVIEKLELPAIEHTSGDDESDNK